MLRSASLCAVCYVLIDTACIVCGRVCVTSICPSIDRCSSVWRVAAVARRAGDINRQQQWRAPHSSTVFSSKCEQCHVVSCRRKLNTDLLIQDQPPSPPAQHNASGCTWPCVVSGDVDTIQRCVAPTLSNMLNYDTRCYFNVRSKADMSQLNLPHGTDN